MVGLLNPNSRDVDDSPSSPNPMDRHWSEFVVEETMNEFPIGWEQRFTATGVMYFVDHINRTTTVRSCALFCETGICLSFKKIPLALTTFYYYPV